MGPEERRGAAGGAQATGPATLASRLTSRASGLAEKLRRAGVALESPILVREMRTLLRGRKFFASHMLLLTVLAGVLLIAATTSAGSAQDPSSTGKALFWSFVFGLGVVVTFLVPAFSCTALTTEREAKTLDLLLTTTIRPWEVVWGKLLSALVVILLFMASALPLITVCFLFGGVSPWELALLYLGVLFCTMVVSSMSLAVSSHCKESKSSVVISYVLTLIFLGLVTAGAAIAADAMGIRGFQDVGANFSGLRWQVQVLSVGGVLFLGTAIFAINFAAAANRLKPPTANRSTNLRVIWLLFLLGCLGLYAASLEAAQSGGQVSKNDWDGILPAALCLAASLLWLSALFFPSEEARLSPRLMEDTSRLRGFLVPLRMFMPGPIAGLFYAAAGIALILGGAAFLGSAAATFAGAAQAAGRNLTAALPVGLFLLCSAGLGALFSSFGMRHRGAGLLAFAASAALAFGPLIHLGCQEAVNDSVVNTLWNLHYLSPIAAGISAWEPGDHTFGQVVLPGGGGLTFPLWAMSTAAYVLLTAGVWIVAVVRVFLLQARWRSDLAAAASGQAPSGPAAPAAPAGPAAPPAG